MRVPKTTKILTIKCMQTQLFKVLGLDLGLGFPPTGPGSPPMRKIRKILPCPTPENREKVLSGCLSVCLYLCHPFLLDGFVEDNQGGEQGRVSFCSLDLAKLQRTKVQLQFALYVVQCDPILLLASVLGLPTISKHLLLAGLPMVSPNALAEPCGTAKTLEIQQQNCANNFLPQKCANYPFTNYPLKLPEIDSDCSDCKKVEVDFAIDLFAGSFCHLNFVKEFPRFGRKISANKIG